MAKRCPRCSLINPPSAQRCECGFDFRAEPSEVRHELERQSQGVQGRIVSGALLFGFGLLVSAIYLISGAGPVIATGACVTGIALLVSGLRRRARLEETRRAIFEPKQGALPEARVIREER